MKNLLTIVLLFSLSLCGAQETSFSAKVSASTVEEGKLFTVEFEIKNADGEFEAPDFGSLKVVQGPSHYSSMQMINGVVTQEKKFIYKVLALEPGLYIIPEATLYTDEGILHTELIEIEVVGEGEAIPDGNSMRPSQVPERLKRLLKGRKIKKL